MPLEPAPVITSPPERATMSNERFGYFHHELEVLALSRQLRAQGLKLHQIAAKLAELGYKNRRDATYSECSISRILNHRGTLTHA